MTLQLDEEVNASSIRRLPSRAEQAGEDVISASSQIRKGPKWVDGKKFQKKKFAEKRTLSDVGQMLRTLNAN
jgi:hypothetical protein